MATRTAAAGDEVAVELLPFIRIYKSGRVERLIGNDDTVPASLDDGSSTSTGGVTSKDVTLDPATNLSVRLYLSTAAAGTAGKKLPIVVYFHGGGFMVESAGSAKYHRYLNALAARAGAVVVSVDYRRVPEHRLPVAYDDSWAALAWAVRGACGSESEFEPEPWLAEHGDPSRVFLAGDSAGANIAHNVAMRAASEDLPAATRIRGVLLMHPYFWDASDAMGPALEERICREWHLMTGRPDARVDDPWLSPTSPGAPPLALLPTQRALVAVAGEDFLAPKGRAYHAALLNSGWAGEAELVDTPDEQHVFFLDKPGTAVAEDLMGRVVAFIAQA